VVIAEGGYILTNNHVIEEGSSFQILMPHRRQGGRHAGRRGQLHGPGGPEGQ
jgi:S1-C subfamily serine protease